MRHPIRIVPLVRRCALFALAGALLAPAPARAQCETWLTGPFADGAEGTDGSVHAMVLWDPDGEGPQSETLVIGGAFSTIQGSGIPNLAMRDPVSGNWVPVGTPGTVPPVGALVVFEGKLVVGCGGDDNPGTFDDIVRIWDGTSWEVLAPSNTGSVYTMVVHQGALYIGGSFRTNFTVPPTDPADRIARWNPAAQKWDNLATITIDGDVMSLVSWNGDLIAGGGFNSIGGLVRQNGIARWDGSDWNSMFLSGGLVSDLQPYLGELYVGGGGLTADGPNMGGLARWNGSTWSSVGGFFLGSVHELAVHTGRLVVSGYFPGTSSPNITQFDGGAYTDLGAGIDYYANVCQSFAGVLYVGGSFANAGGAPASNLARWNGSGWSTVGGGSVGGVLCMTNFLGGVVVGGGFTQSTYSPQPAVNIASWDGLSMSPFGAGLDAQVNALEAFQYPGPFGDHELIAGGYFTHAGGAPANHIARWRASAFGPPTGWEPMGAGMDGAVLAIERYNGATYAGGNFWASGGTALANIGRWNESTDTWENIVGSNGVVYALKAYGGYLYAGGSFTAIGGNFGTGGLARYNGSTWSAVGGFFNGSVYELEVHDGVLVIGGDFTGINASPDLAWYDGSGYGTFGFGGGTDGAVTALHSTGSRLYVGGTFSTAGGVPAHRLAFWDGAWHGGAGGANNTVYAIGSIGGEVQVGGVFSTVGSTTWSPGWARYGTTGLPWFVQQPFSQNVASGANVTFTARPAPGYSQVLRWYRKGSPAADGPTGTGSTIAGATEETLVLANVSTDDAGLYRMVVSNACGSTSTWEVVLTVDGVTDVPIAGGTPADAVEALGPNPTAGPAAIRFALARDAHVEMRVHDLSGRRVRHLDGGGLPAGRHQLDWDGRDDAGHAVRTGLYIVRLDADGRTLGARRLVVQR